MASKFLCRCGETVRINLYEGHGLRLLVPEGITDRDDLVSTQQARAFIDDLVSAAWVVAECPKCGTLALVGDEGRIQLYAPVG